MAKQKCFIIMPITTPPEMVDKYGDDINHFEHVLNFLFIPSIEKAGLEPVPPSRKASENIQAEIIKYLDMTELVLCDISTLNPNVFFELGCRTALNKPVCYVRDNLTDKIPFDNGTIVHCDYDSKLDPWIVEKEIPKLATHLIDSIKNSDGQNTLWKYFGLKTIAQPIDFSQNANTGNDLVLMKIAELTGKIDTLTSDANINTRIANDFRLMSSDNKLKPETRFQLVTNLMNNVLAECGSKYENCSYDYKNDTFKIAFEKSSFTAKTKALVCDLFNQLGVNYKIVILD